MQLASWEHWGDHNLEPEYSGRNSGRSEASSIINLSQLKLHYSRILANWVTEPKYLFCKHKFYYNWVTIMKTSVYYQNRREHWENIQIFKLFTTQWSKICKVTKV
jgi:hypothetical protein